MDEHTQETAALACWAAHSAALTAAAGSLMADNLPTDVLRAIAKHNTLPMLVTAAQMVLHERGEQWRPEPCGSAKSE